MSLRRLLLALPAATLLAAPPMAMDYRGFNPANIDRATRPCDDFYQYAVGGWVKRTPIPAEYSRYGVDEEVEARTSATLRRILEEAAARRGGQGTERQRLGDFYATGMDLEGIERAGLRPLGDLLEEVQDLKTVKDLAVAVAHLQRAGARACFGFTVGPDDRESTRVAAQLSQGGLGLPDRDDYLAQDEASKVLRSRYADHVARMLQLLGDSPEAARHQAGQVLALETRLAAASMTRVALRDPEAIYHRMDLPQLEKQAPGFPWAAYADALGLRRTKGLIVRQPKFFAELGLMALEVPAGTWRPYLRFHLVNALAPFLPRAFDEAHFAFYGHTLSGATEPLPRWKRVTEQTDVAMGEILGKAFVAQAFGPEAKARMIDLVDHLRRALRARLERLPWMSAPTRQKALEKLAAMTVKVGYPDRWRDYDDLNITRRSYVENVLSARSFELNRQLTKLGRPVDRGEWQMTPATNNAYYEPTLNEICFPAGILQPPYFDPAADDAVNYGNIGATIGHEMTHAFDDEGRLYDAEGNLKAWWTPEDEKAFSARTEAVVQQFEAFEPLPGHRINGRMTLGENIADLGGLRIAWDAWQLSRAGKPPVGPIEGFTPEQRFFLGYAETWRTQFREEALRLRLKTDVHSPAKWRVIGPLANMSEFFAAFGCGPEARMWRPLEARPAIW